MSLASYGWYGEGLLKDRYSLIESMAGKFWQRVREKSLESIVHPRFSSIGLITKLTIQRLITDVGITQKHPLQSVYLEFQSLNTGRADLRRL